MAAARSTMGHHLEAGGKEHQEAMKRGIAEK